MLGGHYGEARNVVNQTLNKNYADDETYYLSGLITARRMQSEAIAEWERGIKKYPNSGILNYELAIANRSLSDEKSIEIC